MILIILEILILTIKIAQGELITGFTRHKGTLI